MTALALISILWGFILLRIILKWHVWLTTEHGQVTRKWLHPISQPQLHRAHPARREAKTNRRNFHFNQACLVLCWLTLSKAEGVYLLFLDPLSCQRCLLQVWGPDNFRSNIDHIFIILWNNMCSSRALKREQTFSDLDHVKCNVKWKTILCHPTV